MEEHCLLFLTHYNSYIFDTLFCDDESEDDENSPYNHLVKQKRELLRKLHDKEITVNDFNKSEVKIFIEYIKIKTT